MPRAASDEALIELVEELYERYYTSLFAYVYRLAGDAARAHELVQETFLRLYREREKLREVENQRAWLYGIASRVAFQALRQRGRRRRFARELPLASDSTERDPTARLGDQHIAIERALAFLPAAYRAPLLLHSYFGFPIRDTAVALDLTETAVTTRIYRAKKMFREVYKPDDEQGKRQ